MILRVERNANCINLEPTELQEVSAPVQISRIRVRWKDLLPGSETLTEEYVWADIVGWCSHERGSRCPGYAQRVISEGDEGIVIYGGDWGVKLWVKGQEIGRNILWATLEVARENLPSEILAPLGLDPP